MIKIGQYDYEGLIESYLAQDKQSATTADNRMSYKGIKLFSYNSNLAVINENVPSTLYINKFTSTYSVTSVRHTRKLVAKALPNWTMFTIDFDLTTTENLYIYWNDIELLITRYKRARTTKASIKQSIHEAVSNAQHFAEWHELDSTIPDLLMRQLFVNQLLK